MLRAPSTYLAVILILVGGVWTLQGLGYLEGSPMTGVTLWAVVGPILVVAGLVLLVRAVRSGRPGDPKP